MGSSGPETETSFGRSGREQLASAVSPHRGNSDLRQASFSFVVGVRVGSFDISMSLNKSGVQVCGPKNPAANLPNSGPCMEASRTL